MNWLDIIIAAALALSALIGLWRGFIKTLFSLAGVIVGILIASNFYTQLGGVLTFIPNRSIANIMAFIILLLAVLLLATIVSSMLRAMLSVIRLGCIDRLAGAVLGLIFGSLFVSAILAVAVKLFGPGPVTGSALAGFLLDKFPFVLSLLPKQFGSVRDFFK